MIAARKGWSNIVSDMIRAEANIEAMDVNHHTALMAAILKGRTATVQTLIKSGASPTRKDSGGQSILTTAVEAKSFEVLEHLLALHDLAAEDIPSRLLFTSQDSGHVLEFTYINFEV
jgi:ankyrin repeat protein